MCFCVSVYLCVFFWNICSSLALLSLLYTAHTCSGCSSAEKEGKTEIKRGRDEEREHFCSHFSRVLYLLVKGLASVEFLQAPVHCSHFVFLLFSSFPLSFSPVALLSPSTSLQAADVGSVSRCFVFITLQSHLQQTLTQ